MSTMEEKPTLDGAYPEGMRLLMHACCGPCSLEPTRLLQERGINPTIFYENGNIHPAAEYAHRLATLREWAGSDDPAILAPIPVVEGAYDPSAWEQTVGKIGDHAIDQARELIERAARCAEVDGGDRSAECGADGTQGADGAGLAAGAGSDDGVGELDGAGSDDGADGADGTDSASLADGADSASLADGTDGADAPLEPQSPTPEEARRISSYREAVEGGASPEAALTLAVDPALRKRRCRLCYRARLEATAAYAAANGFTAIGTTLSVSPYQYTDVIHEEVERAAAKAGLEPCFEDYRPHYDEATRRSRARGMYRQNNCGCRISDLEAQAERAQRKAQRARVKAAEAEAHADERAAEEAERAAKRAERRAYNEKQARKRAILKAMREQKSN